MKKKISLYQNKYFIYDNGKIQNIKTKNFLKPYKSTNGYLYIKIVRDKKHHHIKIHRIVADAFIPNPYNLPQVNHKDGNKLNNNVNNLEWCSCSQNIKHGFDNNLYKKRPALPRKINQYDLKGNFIKTWDKIKDIEKEYSVSHTAIRFCCLEKIKTCKSYIWRYADE